MNYVNHVQFPNMGGLEFTIDNVAFKIFGWPVYWYGIIISLAFIVAVVLGMRDSKNFGIEPDDIIDLVIVAAPLSIIGARLYYVIFNWSEFQGDIKSIVNIRTGGLAIYGGVITAVLVTYVFSKIKKIDVLKLLDMGSPYLVLAQAIGRWGNFTNQEAFGVNTNLPWGMTSETIKTQLEILRNSGVNVNPDLPVHPTFLYESLWNLGVFLLLMRFRKHKKLRGEVFCGYVILYGIGRAWIEGLRTDSLMLGPFRVSQVLSVILAVVFIVVFLIRRRRNTLAQEEMGQVSEYSAILKEVRGETDSDKTADIKNDDENL